MFTSVPSASPLFEDVNVCLLAVMDLQRNSLRGDEGEKERREVARWGRCRTGH